jgi:hypothetical protein
VAEPYSLPFSTDETDIFIILSVVNGSPFHSMMEPGFALGSPNIDADFDRALIIAQFGCRLIDTKQ